MSSNGIDGSKAIEAVIRAGVTFFTAILGFGLKDIIADGGSIPTGNTVGGVHWDSIWAFRSFTGAFCAVALGWSLLERFMAWREEKNEDKRWTSIGNWGHFTDVNAISVVVALALLLLLVTSDRTGLFRPDDAASHLLFIGVAFSVWALWFDIGNQLKVLDDARTPAKAAVLPAGEASSHIANHAEGVSLQHEHAR